jgi:hypothetical protein
MLPYDALGMVYRLRLDRRSGWQWPEKVMLGNCHDTGNYLARTMTVAVHRPANKSPPNRAAEERCSIAAISRTKGGRLYQHVGRTLSYSAILAEWMAELTFAL